MERDKGLPRRRRADTKGNIDLSVYVCVYVCTICMYIVYIMHFIS